MIRSAYERLPHALRRDEFFLAAADPDAGVGGIPEEKKIESS